MKGVNSPRFFPRFTVAIMGFCGALLIIEDLRGKGTEVTGKERLLSLRMVILSSIALLFVPLFRILGFFVTAPLLIASVMLVLGGRNWIKISLLALIPPAVIYLFFDQFLQIPLPLGTLFERLFE
jgi:putative tricarboxylic transport membrane protein